MISNVSRKCVFVFSRYAMNYGLYFRVFFILVVCMVAGTGIYEFSRRPSYRKTVYWPQKNNLGNNNSDSEKKSPHDVVQMHQKYSLPLIHATNNRLKNAMEGIVEILPKKDQAKPSQAGHFKKNCTVDNDDCLPVPRIVHYAWYSTTKLQFRFHHYISVLSAYKHIRPKKFMFWYEIAPQGPWWKKINEVVPVIELVYRKAPSEIFGKKIQVAEHQSDIVRLEAVMKYGGIYTDLDVIVLKSFDPLRKYNTTMGYETPGGLCNGIIVSAPNASFLNIWHDTYKSFNDNQWAYHSVQLPARLAKEHHQLIHTEQDTLHRPNWIERDWLYSEGKIWDWSKSYAVHLWYRFHNVDHNPEDVKTLNTTMGQLFRYIYYGSEDLIKP